MRLSAGTWSGKTSEVPVICVAETVSRNSRPEWDAASACGPVGKPHPTPIKFRVELSA